MLNPNRFCKVNHWSMWLLVLAIGLAATAGRAKAQGVWIAPNHSVVQIGRPQPLPIGGFYNVGPVVVGPGNRFVRIGGAYSGFVVNPRFGFNGPVFVKPFTANQRIQASNFLRPPQMQAGPNPFGN